MPAGILMVTNNRMVSFKEKLAEICDPIFHQNNFSDNELPILLTSILHLVVTTVRVSPSWVKEPEMALNFMNVAKNLGEHFVFLEHLGTLAQFDHKLAEEILILYIQDHSLDQKNQILLFGLNCIKYHWFIFAAFECKMLTIE